MDFLAENIGWFTCYTDKKFAEIQGYIYSDEFSKVDFKQLFRLWLLGYIFEFKNEGLVEIVGLILSHGINNEA